MSEPRNLSRLSAFLRECRAVVRDYNGVVWGELDCLHFALGAAACAGRRDLRPLVPEYRTQAQAYRQMIARGYWHMRDLMDAYAERIAATAALPGDVACLPGGRWGSLGVVVGADAVFLGSGGFVRHCLRGLEVWRV